MNIKEKFNEVRLEKETHTYFNNKTGEEYQSVSDFISQFKEPFDPTGEILINCARKKGVKPEELRAEWRNIAKIACDYGTAVHEEIEHFLKTGEIRQTDYKNYVKKFSKFKFTGELFSEQIIYSKDLKLAGTADLINVAKDNTVKILDFKTNKKLHKFSIYRKRMLSPLSHLHDCNFNHYQLQISTYLYLLDLEGLWAGDCSIVYINRETKDLEIHPINYMRKEVLAMLAHRKMIKERVVEDFDF